MQYKIVYACLFCFCFCNLKKETGNFWLDEHISLIETQAFLGNLLMRSSYPSITRSSASTNQAKARDLQQTVDEVVVFSRHILGRAGAPSSAIATGRKTILWF